jgi:hypothetical protein
MTCTFTGKGTRTRSSQRRPGYGTGGTAVGSTSTSIDPLSPLIRLTQQKLNNSKESGNCNANKSKQKRKKEKKTF